MPAATTTAPTRPKTKNGSPRKKGLKKKPTAVSKYEEELAFERTISRILLHRFEYDVARLFSTHIHRVAESHLPRLIMSALQIAPPGWVALNANTEEVKDFFRGALALDMRQAGERVATKSVLWSYTAIRHFAVSHDVPICGHRGLHSHLLLPHHKHMRAHLRTLESSPDAPAFTKPPHLGGLSKGHKALERYCLSRVKGAPMGTFPPEWQDWRTKIREGYDRMVETLWEVANELNVRGYGLVLREKLSDKWCCLSCLGTYLEVCEPTLGGPGDPNNPTSTTSTITTTSSDPNAPPTTSTTTSTTASLPPSMHKGKEREWDGRGAGVLGWETADEEDMWKAKLDFGGAPSDYQDLYLHDDEDEDVLSVGELMELRYIKAEREKELGNIAFKKSQYDVAIQHYENAYRIEPEIPYYQLNLAAAHLKLHQWIQAESACTVALGQQKSSKAYYRRARARKMQGRIDEAEHDLLAILDFQSTNTDAIVELETLRPPEHMRDENYYNQYPYPSPPASPHAAYSSPASCSHGRLHGRSPSPHATKGLPSSGGSSSGLGGGCSSSPGSSSYSNSRWAGLEGMTHWDGSPLKLNERPIPWEIHEKDRVRLKIQFVPLTIQIDPRYGSETFNYPSWERYQVTKA